MFHFSFLHEFGVVCSQIKLPRPRRAAQCFSAGLAPGRAASLLALRAGDEVQLWFPMGQAPACAAPS